MVPNTAVATETAGTLLPDPNTLNHRVGGSSPSQPT